MNPIRIIRIPLPQPAILQIYKKLRNIPESVYTLFPAFPALFPLFSRSFPGSFPVLSPRLGMESRGKLFYGAVAEDKKGNTKLNWFWLEMPGNPGDDVTILDSPKK